MLGMLARQACRQHVVIGNDTRAEMTKNALNLCDFFNNSRNRSIILLVCNTTIHGQTRHKAKTF